MDNLFKKLASNDKMLETINNRMDSFSNVIKNQHSFNKMIESQISQLATVVPPANQGKILRQPEELESTNLIDIFNAGSYWSDLQLEDGTMKLCQSKKVIQGDRSFHSPLGV
jgi:hypothetical protein